MTKEELLVAAKDLDIQNAESLAYNELQKAVSQAKKAIEDNTNTSETDPEPTENPDTTSSNPDPPFVTPKVNTEPKTNYTDEVGRVYTFTDRAPSSFRFNGLIKSKEDWLQDQEAMEQLAMGNCSYVEQILN